MREKEYVYYSFDYVEIAFLIIYKKNRNVCNKWTLIRQIYKLYDKKEIIRSHYLLSRE